MRIQAEVGPGAGQELESLVRIPAGHTNSIRPGQEKVLCWTGSATPDSREVGVSCESGTMRTAGGG